MKIRMHNGSRLLSLLLAVVLVFTLTVPALAADKPQDMNLRIAVMSDLHYLSPDMIADTADFEHALNSDRKLLKESSAILYEKFEQVRADKPDILLVSGDLTKDGEQECHAALAKQLQQLQQMPAMPNEHCGCWASKRSNTVSMRSSCMRKSISRTAGSGVCSITCLSLIHISEPTRH